MSVRSMCVYSTSSIMCKGIPLHKVDDSPLFIYWSSGICMEISL